jgi:hypothetical protein
MEKMGEIHPNYAPKATVVDSAMHAKYGGTTARAVE